MAAPALVADLGQDRFRLGRAGQSTPCVSLASNSFDVEGRRGALENGLVADWNLVEKLWERGFERLAAAEGVAVGDAPRAMVLAEPSFNQKALHRRHVELLFEACSVDTLFTSKCAVLSCYANGRTTGVAVDVGEAQTRIVPVHEGFILQSGLNRTGLGGASLTQHLSGVLEGANRDTVGSLGRVEQNTMGRLVKETFCRVRAAAPAGLPAGASSSSSSSSATSSSAAGPSEPHAMDVVATDGVAATASAFTLPDGTSVNVPGGCFAAPELLFDPTPLDRPGLLALQNAVLQSISKVDVDLRKSMFANIVLAGGSTALDGLPLRLEKEVADCVGGAERVRVLAAAPADRGHTHWIGASILGTLGTLKDMWVSREEYLEHGATIIERKCP